MLKIKKPSQFNGLNENWFKAISTGITIPLCQF